MSDTSAERIEGAVRVEAQLQVDQFRMLGIDRVRGVGDVTILPASVQDGPEEAEQLFLAQHGQGLAGRDHEAVVDDQPHEVVGPLPGQRLR
jgi:hypothetical protein